MPKLIPEYKELIKTKIIQASFSVFLEKGYQKSTIEEIAEKAGISKPTVYSYFKNKEDILETISIRDLENPPSYPKNFKERDSLDALDELYDMLIELKESLPFYFEIFALTSSNKTLGKSYSTRYNQRIEAFQTFLRKQQDRGTIRDDVDAHTLSQLLVALENHILIQLVLQMDENKIHETWSKLLNAILKK